MPDNLLNLPIEQKIGQLFFIGLPTFEITPATRSLLNDLKPGGVCLFARNIRSIEQTRRLNNEIIEILPVQPLLSIDQEGGLVDRLRRLLTPMPAPRVIHQKGGLADVRAVASIIAEVLRLLGFNMDFAPVVDVITPPREKFSNALYTRIYGDTKYSVTEFAGAFLDSLQAGGVLGCLKHFPGLGASNIDSHEELPVADADRKELFETDLFPYRSLFESHQIPAVMVAHATFPNFDLQEKDSNGKLLPTSLSRQIIEQLLRKELGFRGLTITDDLEMGAILKNYSFGEACKMAIVAGEDMLCLSSNIEAMHTGFEAILKAVQTGEISENRIDESLQRISKLKSLAKPALDFEATRLAELSAEIAGLNAKLNYSYGG
jgi:beta-N-acetylhexosaminidase